MLTIIRLMVVWWQLNRWAILRLDVPFWWNSKITDFLDGLRCGTIRGNGWTSITNKSNESNVTICRKCHTVCQYCQFGYNQAVSLSIFSRFSWNFVQIILKYIWTKCIITFIWLPHLIPWDRGGAFKNPATVVSVIKGTLVVCCSWLRVALFCSHQSTALSFAHQGSWLSTSPGCQGFVISSGCGGVVDGVKMWTSLLVPTPR